MSDPHATDRPDPTDNEHDVLQRLQDDLAARYPAVPAAVIADHVHRAAAQFDQAPIREYIPVLIARTVQAELGAPTPAPEP